MKNLNFSASLWIQQTLWNVQNYSTQNRFKIIISIIFFRINFVLKKKSKDRERRAQFLPGPRISLGVKGKSVEVFDQAAATSTTTDTTAVIRPPQNKPEERTLWPQRGRTETWSVQDTFLKRKTTHVIVILAGMQTQSSWVDGVWKHNRNPSSSLTSRSLTDITVEASLLQTKAELIFIKRRLLLKSHVIILTNGSDRRRHWAGEKKKKGVDHVSDWPKLD